MRIMHAAEEYLLACIYSGNEHSIASKIKFYASSILSGRRLLSILRYYLNNGLYITMGNVYYKFK